MRVLFYNWVDYLDPEGRGGGVSIYQRNLMEAFGDGGPVEPTFLCAGISYDLLSDTPRWERIRHGPRRDRHRRYEIVNSRVLAPAHFSFGHRTQVSCPETRAAFVDFCRARGPFDVIHFNNLEGLPADVLTLKEEFPDTRIVYTLHNYYPLCPQVNLWHQERETCTDFDEGRKCVECLPDRPDAQAVRQADAVAYLLKRMGIAPGTRPFDFAFRRLLTLAGGATGAAAKVLPQARAVRGFGARVTTSRPAGAGLPRTVESPALRFRSRREAMVSLMNAHCDRILCVSGRVAELARRYGYDPGLLQVAYIGTREAEKFAATAPKERLLRPDGTLALGYLGYMRRDKGFFFLLDALEELPEAAARRVHLVIAARSGPPEAMARVEALSDRFASVRHADGYSHATLDALLAEVDVGVVPVLWEDNLPQVAIEMHARHIPLITSDLGGARELGATEQMVFRAGSAASFRDVLLDLLAERVDLDAYWRRARAPTSMAEHAAGLRALYAELTGAAGPAPAETAGEAAEAADAAAGPHPAQTFEEPGAIRLDRGRHA